MDFTSALKPDVYRVIMVILLPGIIASLPWIGFIYWPEILNENFWNSTRNALASLSLILFIALAVGVFIENIGSKIEAENVDKYVQKELNISEVEFNFVWHRYLESSSNKEIIATRYISAFNSIDQSCTS